MAELSRISRLFASSHREIVAPFVSEGPPVEDKSELRVSNFCFYGSADSAMGVISSTDIST